MTTLARCQCGAEADSLDQYRHAHVDDGFYIECDECLTRGPSRLMIDEAIAAWNALMRPRPVAEWRQELFERLCCGTVRLGEVICGSGGRVTGSKPGTFTPWSHLDDCAGPTFLTPHDAREWMEAKAREHGFEVRNA